MSGRFRGAALLGGGTVAAALLGVFFQALLANWFGAGAETDAWFMSLSIFAFLAKFLMLTHLKSIALPVYRRLHQQAPGEARRLVIRLLVWLGGGVAAASVLLVLAAPWLVDLLAPGYQGAMRELTVTLVRIRIPALVFLGFTAAGLVALESAHRFGVTVAGQKLVPAAVTLLLLLVIADRYGMVGVGWVGLTGGVAGGLLVLAMVAPLLRRPQGEEPATGEHRGAARRELRGIGSQWLRFSGSNGATLLGEWAFRVAASLLPVGLFSAVLYGRMVHDLLHGAVNDAAQTVSLPRFASAAAAAEGGAEAVGRELRESLGTLAAVNVPTATFVALSASWLVALLFGRGQFLADGMLGPAATALRIFALGFLLQGLNQVLFAAAFASDRAPLVNRVQIVGHLARALWLVPAVMAFSFVGLVGAQVAMNVLVLLLLLRFAPDAWEVTPGRSLRALVGTATGRGVLGSTLLLAAGWVVAAPRLPDPLALGTVARTLTVGALGTAWFGGYVLLAGALGVRPVREGWGRLRRWGRGVLPVGLVAVFLLAGAGEARAQSAAGGPGAPAPEVEASVGGALLPADHWSRAVLELLEARGALPVGSTRAGPLSGERVEALLAAARDPEAEAAWTRLRQEAGASGAFPASAGLWGGARTVRTGTPGSSGGLARLTARMGGAGDPVFASVAAEAGPGGAERALVRGAVGVRLGPLALHLGRHRIQLGGGTGGSLVLSPSLALDGALLVTEEPFRLPVVGDTHVTAGLFPLGRYEGVEDPWFALLRLSFAPDPAFRVGVSRAAMVGGYFPGGSPPFDPATYGPDERSMDAGDVLGILVGRVTGFDNQLFGLDVRASLARTGIPLQLTAEVALEDNQRSWGDGALQLGALLAPRTTLPLTVRYEYTGVGDPGRWCAWCDTLPAFWYGHTRFQDGWRVGDELAGHPLGGYGLQHRAEVALHDPGMALRARAAVTRQRRDRWNLLEPTRPGWSWGMDGGLRLRLSRRLEMAGDARLEWGDAGWTAGRASLLLGVLLGGSRDPGE